MYDDPTESFRSVELMQGVYHTPDEAPMVEAYRLSRQNDAIWGFS